MSLGSYRRTSLFDWVLLACTLLVLLVIWIIVDSQKSACAEKGGTLVRGVVWYACVASPVQP